MRTSHLVHCVACFGVIFFNCFHLFVFYDIGSDGKVTLWERAARSVTICFLYHVES